MTPVVLGQLTAKSWRDWWAKAKIIALYFDGKTWFVSSKAQFNREYGAAGPQWLYLMDLTCVKAN